MLHLVASHPTPVRVHVEADTRLARAGLMRAARRAGIHVVPSEELASFTLRSATLPSCEPDIEVLVRVAVIDVAVREAPSREVWSAIRRLLREFFADTDTE